MAQDTTHRQNDFSTWVVYFSIPRQMVPAYDLFSVAKSWLYEERGGEIAMSIIRIPEAIRIESRIPFGYYLELKSSEGEKSVYLLDGRS